MPPTIETSGLTRAFGGRPAVEDLTFEAHAGEVLAVLGPNGAGKTTTVRMLDGVLRPDRGWCRVLGLDPEHDGNAVRRRTAVLTETAGLDERLTPRENLTTTARIRGLTGQPVRRRIDDLLERLGVGHRADVALAGASTGQRKRVALAGALVHEPEVLFLDEPTSGLDPAASRDVVDLIAELAEEQGRTVVLCTHLLGEASRLATRVAILGEGRLRGYGTPAELARQLTDGLPVSVELGRPADDATVALLAAGRGVRRAEPAPEGAHVVVGDRNDVPALVQSLVTAGADVYGVAARRPTLEDVYFTLQAPG